jgi:GntR family transcriptional regulator / MocR family aminotransferase
MSTLAMVTGLTTRRVGVDRAAQRRPTKGRPWTITLLEGTAPDGTPTYARLYRSVRQLILDRALVPGASLPSSRTLAADLSVSRNTVEAAYAQLRAEGFIVRRIGAGTVVAETSREAAPFARRPVSPRRAPAVLPALSLRGAQLRDDGLAELAGDRQAGPCATDVSLFPAITWQRLLTRAARSTRSALLPGDAQGVRALREAIAAHVRVTRGVNCTADQVVITSSTQQALDLLSRLLLDPDDVAAVEDPGYRGARGALRASGARVLPIPVDERGLMVDALPSAGVRLVYVTPSHQYPLGVTLALSRRLALIEWAARSGAWILEDDYDSEFRYDGRPIASLQGLDPTGRVLYIGTWNKVLFPGLRIGYVIVPPVLVDAVVAARRIADGASSPVIQSALARLLADGYVAAYLRSARRSYAARRDALVKAVADSWNGQATLGPTNTGLHGVAHLHGALDDERIAAAALPTGGLGVSPLSRYYAASPASRGLMLNYGASTEDAIRRGIAHLTSLVTVTHAPRRSPSRRSR